MLIWQSAVHARESWDLVHALTSSILFSQRLLPIDGANDLFFQPPPLTPTSKVYTIRPYFPKDEVTASAFCCPCWCFSFCGNTGSFGVPPSSNETDVPVSCKKTNAGFRRMEDKWFAYDLTAHCAAVQLHPQHDCSLPSPFFFVCVMPSMFLSSGLKWFPADRGIHAVGAHAALWL